MRVFDLEPRVESLLAAAARGGVEAELYIQERRTVTQVMGQQGTERCLASEDRGAGIRAAARGRIGFAYTNDLSEEGLLACLEQASRGLAYGRPGQLPADRGPGSEVPGIADPRLLQYRAAEGQALLEAAAARLAGGAHGVQLLEAVLTTAYQRTYIASTTGIRAPEVGTWANLSVRAAASRNGKIGIGWRRQSVRTLAELSPQEVAGEAEAQALSGLEDGPAGQGRMPVILEPFPFASLLATTLGSGLVEGTRLPLVEREGRVASALFSLTDNGRLPGGLASRAADEEGIPTRETALIDGGRLVGCLRGSDRPDATGSARRRCVRWNTFLEPTGAYAYEPEPGPSNLVVAAGPGSLEELIADTGEGLLVGGLIGVFATGPDISVTTSRAWKIQGGRIAHPVGRTMLAGNFFELLHNISGLANDVRPVDGDIVVVSPSVRMEDVMVVG